MGGGMFLILRGRCLVLSSSQAGLGAGLEVVTRSWAEAPGALSRVVSLSRVEGIAPSSEENAPLPRSLDDISDDRPSSAPLPGLEPPKQPATSHKEPVCACSSGVLDDDAQGPAASAASGTAAILGSLEAGECFGEGNLLTESPSANTVEASEPSVMVCLPRGAWQRFARSHPELEAGTAEFVRERMAQTLHAVHSPLCAGMSWNEFRLFAGQALELQYRRPGEVIFKAGETYDELWIVVSGSALLEQAPERLGDDDAGVVSPTQRQSLPLSAENPSFSPALLKSPSRRSFAMLSAGWRASRAVLPVEFAPVDEGNRRGKEGATSPTGGSPDPAGSSPPRGSGLVGTARKYLGSNFPRRLPGTAASRSHVSLGFGAIFGCKNLLGSADKAQARLQTVRAGPAGVSAFLVMKRAGFERLCQHNKRLAAFCRLVSARASEEVLIDDVLNVRDARKELRAFLEKERSVENLDFFVAAERFSRLDLPSRRLEFPKIVAEYVARDAPFEINVPAMLRAPVLAICSSLSSKSCGPTEGGIPCSLESAPDKDALAECQKEVRNVMEKDGFARFRRSEEFRALQRRWEGIARA